MDHFPEDVVGDVENDERPTQWGFESRAAADAKPPETALSMLNAGKACDLSHLSGFL
jgi:hypothetical protein